MHSHRHALQSLPRARITEEQGCYKIYPRPMEGYRVRPKCPLTTSATIWPLSRATMAFRLARQSSRLVKHAVRRLDSVTLHLIYRPKIISLTLAAAFLDARALLPSRSRRASLREGWWLSCRAPLHHTTMRQYTARV